jgi:Domain of unknown function (DUF4865)
MIAMQYSFTLPADYDMAIIDRRIAEKGPLLDNFPKLKFKAYLTGRKGGQASGDENLYAPFYVWDEDEGLSNFVCGEGFAAVSQAFGWPRIKTWIVWRASVGREIAKARFATREILAIAPHARLEDLRKRESEEAKRDVDQGGALASVAGFEPTSWTRVRFRLWAERPSHRDAGIATYSVGHLSAPSRRDGAPSIA